MITLPGVGDIRAAGLTPEALAKSIGNKYLETKIFTKGEARGELKNYKMVTVNVVSFYQKIKKLVESLTTLTGGQQMQVTINPDGTIDLPLMRERIMAVGHTVREVESTINERYTLGPLKHVVASLSLLQANSRKVYVMGEVQRPGGYDLKQPITALQAIALAGGPISEFADLTSVILISKDVNGKPIGRRLDLKRTLDVGDLASAILIKPYDVIFVPKTFIRDVRVFMDQYVGTVAQIAQLVNVLNNKD
jgi:polysaccharide export outer membrane protein